MSATVFYNSSSEFATCANVFSISGTPQDPTTVALVITDPGGVQTTYTWPAGTNLLTRASAGSFTQDVPCSSAVADGIWSGVWTGTGEASDVQAFTWDVINPLLNRNYCSAEELKSRLRLNSTSDDSELAIAVAGASRGIDLFCERQFFRTTETRTFVPHDLYEARIDDYVSITALATDPSGTAVQGSAYPVTWLTSDWQPLPYNTNRNGEPWPYTRIRAVGTKTFPWIAPIILTRLDRVQVTGVWGWPQVPWAVRTAALLTASGLFRAKDMPGGGNIPGEFAIAVIAGNPEVGSLLGPYLKHAFLAA